MRCTAHRATSAKTDTVKSAMMMMMLIATAPAFRKPNRAVLEPAFESSWLVE